jgi:hypothetical protein
MWQRSFREGKQSGRAIRWNYGQWISDNNTGSREVAVA